MRYIRADVDVEASGPRVLRALTDPAEIAAWWGADGGVVEAAPGGRFELRFGGVVARGRVEAATERGLVVADLHTVGPDGDMGPTRLAFGIKPKSHKTVVLVEETGFGEGAAWDAYYENARASWPIALLDLKRHVERGPAPARA